MVTFRLITFGGLTLQNRQGVVVPAQRRRLALLAVLASAGEAGVRRDQLVGLMWPESTDDSAKHSLQQLLYGLRKSIDDSLFIGLDPIRLNNDVLSSDVADFESSVSRGDIENAAALCSGTFLEGFHLGGAVEFERWLDGERARLGSKCADAMDKLAANAESAGEWTTAIKFRLKLAALEPISARRAVQLMRALASAGDVSGAINHARTFEALVKEEIGTPADAAVLSYAAELRERKPVADTPANVPSFAETHHDRTDSQAATTSAAEPPVRTQSDSPRPKWTWSYTAFAVALLLALGAGAIYLQADKGSSKLHAVSSGVQSQKDPSIAVLAFENASQDSAVEYYSYGLTDALIEGLTSSGSLRVIQGPSAFVLRGHRTDTRGIADSLGVSNILASGVLIEGTDMRVSVKLINGADGAVRWSRTYHGSWENRFALQDSIEVEVPRELALRVAGAQRGVRRGLPRTHRAYELYLRGKHQWNAPAAQPMVAMRTALRYFQGALDEDSTYAEAYAGLAASYLIIATGNLTDFDPRVAADSARIAAHKAVFYNDSLPEAHAALAGVNWLVDYDWPAANAELARAVALNPYYSRAPLWASVYYEWTNQLQAAVDEAAKTVSTDPLSPNAVVEYARALYFMGRTNEAKAQVERARSLDSVAERLNLTSGEIFLKERNYPLALREFERFARLTHRSSRSITFLSFALAASGNHAKAEAILAELLTRAKAGKATSFDLAIAYAGLGNLDNAFIYLNRSYDDRSIRPLIRDPSFSALQKDPRFTLLLRRMKLPA